MTVEAAQYVKAQSGAVKLALRDLRLFWGRMDLSSGVASRVALEAFWPELLARYGAVTATLAADRFEELTGLPATMVRPVDPVRANARMRWAVEPLFTGQGDALARMSGLADELVKQPGRSTMIRSVGANGIRYARVPSGSGTCTFCLMLASRGAVYVSQESASRVSGRSLGGTDYKKLRRMGDSPASRDVLFAGVRGPRAARASMKAASGDKFHADCNCRTEPVANDADLDRLEADGYSPADVFNRWQDALTAEQSARDTKSTP